LSAAKDHPAVAALVEFLAGDSARRIIHGYGYER
jgi:ABC-type molybdate transport system substrate-binding protein